MEINQYPFLNTKVVRELCTIKLDWYRKACGFNRFLNYFSNYSFKQKLYLMLAKKQRINSICILNLNKIP